MKTALNSTPATLDADTTAARTAVVVPLPTLGTPPESMAASPEIVARRLEVAMRDFGRVSAVLSTCAAALPAECVAGEPDVRGTLEVAERMLSEAVASLEAIHD